MPTALQYHTDKHTGAHKYALSMHSGAIICIKWLLSACNCVFSVLSHWGLYSKFERIQMRF